MLDKIESEYNHFIFSKNKFKKKTEFMKELSKLIGTSLSNLYEIIKDGLITTLDYELRERIEFSSTVAFNKRNKKSVESNSSKREKAKPFIELIMKELKSPYNINSVDEIINDFKKNRFDEIASMITICTSTFYNFVNDDKIDNFDISLLPVKPHRKQKNDIGYKEGKRKRDNINSIENRPFKPTDREDFGHWEGDTVVGSSKI